MHDRAEQILNPIISIVTLSPLTMQNFAAHLSGEFVRHEDRFEEQLRRAHLKFNDMVHCCHFHVTKNT